MSSGPFLLLLLGAAGGCVSRGPVQDPLKTDLTICEAMTVLARNVPLLAETHATRTYTANLASSFRAATCGHDETCDTGMIGLEATKAVRVLKLGAELNPTQEAALTTFEDRLREMLGEDCPGARLPDLLDRVARHPDGLCRRPPPGDWLTHVEDRGDDEKSPKQALYSECILRHANPAALGAYLGLEPNGACKSANGLGKRLLDLSSVVEISGTSPTQ